MVDGYWQSPPLAMCPTNGEEEEEEFNQENGFTRIGTDIS